jgi:hypothetical protein
VYVAGTFTLTNSTIATNSAHGGDGGSGGAGRIGGPPGQPGSTSGGGLAGGNSLHTHDTLLAQNTVNGAGSNDGPDLSGNLGSLGYNLIGNTQGGSGFDSTDLLSVNPLLGPLQDNGGPTQTMALLPGSPAIDAGDPAGQYPRWDQRGHPYHRVVNGRIDIGAFEVQSAATGPGTPGIGWDERQLLAALVSSRPLSTGLPALWSAAMAPDPAASPSLTQHLRLTPEEPSGSRALSVDQWFASVAAEARGRMADRWPNRESVMLVWSSLDPVPEEADLAP